MEYSVKGLSALAGVSPRTLRYYDVIGLLKPLRITDAGYRVYGADEVDALQQILFYRELGVELSRIKEIMNSVGFERVAALKDHREKLLLKRERIELLIKNLEQSIAAQEGGDYMDDNKKFEGFKKKLIEENEAAYGEELRERYGEEAVKISNDNLLNLSKEQYEAMERANVEVLRLLDEAFDIGDPACEAAQKAAEKHKEWLSYTWKDYFPQAHLALADMYLADDRFTAYYDRGIPGKAKLLRDAIHNYLGKEI